MDRSEDTFWEPHVAALMESWKQWRVDDIFKDSFARAAVSYLKPQWMWDSTIVEHAASVLCITHFTVNDTHMLASGGSDCTVNVFRYDAGLWRCEMISEEQEHTHVVYCVTHFTIDRTHMLLSGSHDGTVREWHRDADKQQWDLRAVLNGNTGPVKSITHFTTFDTDNLTHNLMHNLALGGGSDCTLRVWRRDGGIHAEVWRAQESRQGHTDHVTCITHFTLPNNYYGPILLKSEKPGELHPRGTHVLASGDRIGTIRMWHSRTGLSWSGWGHALRGHSVAVQCITHFTIGDTEMLASGDWNGNVRVWRYSGDAWWKAYDKLRGHLSCVQCITHFTIGNTHMLASGGDDDIVQVWRYDAGTQRWCAHETLKGQTDSVRSITYFTMGDTRVLVFAGGNGYVQLYRCNAGTRQWGTA